MQVCYSDPHCIWNFLFRCEDCNSTSAHPVHQQAHISGFRFSLSFCFFSRASNLHRSSSTLLTSGKNELCQELLLRRRIFFPIWPLNVFFIFFFNMASFYGLYSYHYTFTCFTMRTSIIMNTTLNFLSISPWPAALITFYEDVPPTWPFLLHVHSLLKSLSQYLH